MKKTTLLLLASFVLACPLYAGKTDAKTDGKANAVQVPADVKVSGYGPIETISGAQTTISWTPVEGATGYNIYWSSASGVTAKSTVIKTSDTKYVHGGLTYGHTYYYRVAAIKGDKVSKLSKQESSIARVYTTLQRQIVPTPVTVPDNIRPFDIALFANAGLGKWTYGAGAPYAKRLDLMPADYKADAVKNTGSLLHFFTISDIHITDKESPAEAVFFGLSKKGIISAYSPAMLYTTHVLDAAIRTANALNKESRLDFGISLGDDANSTQYNELRWFIDVIDGKMINPSSGKHAGADKWDYQKPYKAAGLDRSIPWYSTLGNHDHIWVGSFPVNDKTRKAAVGSTMLNIGNIFTTNLGTSSTGYYMGAIDGSTEFGTPVGAGPVERFAVPPTVTPDPDRRELARNEWMGEFFNTTSKPVGHGFSRKNAKKGFACYTFKPNPKLPIEVIVLDDTQSENDPSDGANGPDWGHGSLDAQRYAWLVSELDKGQASGNLMIIAAHIPIGVTKPGALDGWSSLAAVTESDLIAKLKTYPNLLLWMAGHRHFTTITPMPSTDAAHPELGFWEVETGSLREFPQQLRTFRIARNSDDTVSVYITNVDPIIDNSPAATGRSYAIAGNQIFDSWQEGVGLNAELVKKLTPAMQAKLNKLHITEK